MELQRNASARAIELSGSVAANLNARLMAADAIIENAAIGDGAAGALLLRQRLLRSGAIRSVVVLSWQTAFAPAERAPVPLLAAHRQLLNSGEAVLVSQTIAMRRAPLSGASCHHRWHRGGPSANCRRVAVARHRASSRRNDHCGAR
jgi:hypothetical protein